MTDALETRLAGLMVAAQGGDDRAFRELLSASVPLLVAFARRQGVPPDRVDDAVQESLLTLHRARATYDPARAFLPWLRAIGRARAIDTLRRHGRAAAREVHDALAYDNATAGQDTPDAALDLADRAAVLRAAVASLPDGQREAVERLALGEQSLAEAAAQTGRTKVALKVNLHRAIAGLRRRMRAVRSEDA